MVEGGTDELGEEGGDHGQHARREERSEAGESGEDERRFRHLYAPVGVVLLWAIIGRDPPDGSHPILTRACDGDNRSAPRRKEQLRIRMDLVGAGFKPALLSGAPQGEAEERAVARLALDVHRAPVSFDEAPGNREPQSSARSAVLVGTGP